MTIIRRDYDTMMRETLGTVARLAREIEDSAMQRDTTGVYSAYTDLSASIKTMLNVKEKQNGKPV